MIKGLYTSASGMIPKIKKQEISSHNLANASTPGYKKDMIFSKELSRAERKKISTQADWMKPMVEKVYTDYSQGIFDKTENSLDLAIEGDGFFQLQLEDGSTVLTRSGNFIVNQDGMIAFPGGALLIGEGGALEVGNGKVTVGQTGDIQSDGAAVGKITPVTVDDLTQLVKVGGSFYAVPDGVQVTPIQTSSIQQGYLESSNVDIVGEMIEMIISFREFEANAKSIQAQDQSLSHLFSRVGGKG